VFAQYVVLAHLNDLANCHNILRDSVFERWRLIAAASGFPALK